MCGAERVQDVDVAQSRVLPRPGFVVGLLPRVEPHVLQDGDLTRGHLDRAEVALDQPHRARQVLLEGVDDRKEGELLLVFALGGPVQVGGDHDPGALLQRGLERRRGRADTGVGDDPPVLEGNVQIRPDQNALVLQVHLGHFRNATSSPLSSGAAHRRAGQWASRRDCTAAALEDRPRRVPASRTWGKRPEHRYVPHHGGSGPSPFRRHRCTAAARP